MLYNTLTREKEIFKPIKKGSVGMYSCGPTVYWFQHIGNLRTYLFSDFLRRVLEFNDFKVKHVINVTDVGHLTSDRDEGEDKMERAALKEGKKASEVARFYFDLFVSDLKKLNVKLPWKWSWATAHIKEQIKLVEQLERKGYTYRTSDGIYFDSLKFKNYGELARLNVEGLKAGKRVGFGEKKSKSDFALWKFSQEGRKRQQEWNSPWGIGFPGWHLECSAMSMKYLGESFDIHTGGEDHVPIHHTNEIAQSESATGKKFVSYWLHGAFLLNKGEKVSKSKGGLFTISELEEQGYSPLDFRYLALMTHYRKPLSFSLDNLDAARNGLQRVRRKIAEIKKFKLKGKDLSKKYLGDFLEAVNDDLNMSQALDVTWKVLDDLSFGWKEKMNLLGRFDRVLGLDISKISEKERVPEKVRRLIKERDVLREKKLFAEADVVRERIREEGFVVEDSEEGSVLRKV